MNMNNDKLIYLKALCKTKGHKKVAKEIADGIRHLNKYGELKVTYKADKKPVSVKDDNIEGREFILGFAKDFLGHAVDYSIDDKLDGILGSSK
jgi:hypothetical protein